MKSSNCCNTYEMVRSIGYVNTRRQKWTGQTSYGCSSVFEYGALTPKQTIETRRFDISHILWSYLVRFFELHGVVYGQSKGNETASCTWTLRVRAYLRTCCTGALQKRVVRIMYPAYVSVQSVQENRSFNELFILESYNSRPFTVLNNNLLFLYLFIRPTLIHRFAKFTSEVHKWHCSVATSVCSVRVSAD